MVWPTLISVAVTPRISAATDAAGPISATSALATPSPVTKRIDNPPPILFFGAAMAAATGAVRAPAAEDAMARPWTLLIIASRRRQPIAALTGIPARRSHHVVLQEDRKT